ncbi:argininosuccinate lyase [Kamptonema cortianum]|nr:argininosuccinate lyase [Geitlerinema splendidum]MDK3158794.1 argininosuccinate lyase [Kamptonema cortianum]
MRRLWGGAFGDSDDFATEFGRSLESDLILWQEDVRGSIAHARMLGKTGIISRQESDSLIRGLQQILEEGPEELSPDAEDIHTAIEFRLGEIVGDVAGKLHTARSRNDQVATDTRLWLLSQIEDLSSYIKVFQGAILRKASRHKNDLLPGSTHQQHGQPISLGFHLLAYFFAFQRHGRRLQHLRDLTAGSPLGSAALAGTPFPIDRELTSEELGFDAPMPNALDATSDRSFVLDALHTCHLIMLDLSRLSNEIVLWCTPEFGFLQLPDSLTTGSSIMPQKRNPDLAELVRGRVGITAGNYIQVSTLMKGLVMGYNRDTQEDKPPLFSSVHEVSEALLACTRMIEEGEFQVTNMRQSLRGDFSTATDLADAMAKQGIPFRTAHELTGKIVRHCLENQIGLEELRAEDLESISPEIPKSILESTAPEISRLKRESEGGTGPEAVERQLTLATRMLDESNFNRLWNNEI